MSSIQELNTNTQLTLFSSVRCYVHYFVDFEKNDKSLQ